MKFKIAIGIVLGIFALIVGAMLLIQSSFGQNLGLKFLKEALQESGYQVEVGRIEGTIPHAMELYDVKIRSSALDISIDSIQTRLSLLALLKKDLLFTDVKAQGISWQEKEGKTEGELGIAIPFELAIQHFELLNVKGPNFPSTDFEGSFKAQKKNQAISLNLNAKRADVPDALFHVLLNRDQEGFFRLKGNFKTPTLQVLPKSPPFDAAVSLQFVLKGKKRLVGRVRGIATPRMEDLADFRSFVETPWQVSSNVVMDPEKGWSFSKLSAKTDHLSVQGTVDLAAHGEFKQADLHLQSLIPKIDIEINLAPKEEGIAVQMYLNSPSLFTLEDVHLHLDALWQEKTIRGSAIASSLINANVWKATSELLWTLGGSLFLKETSLQGPTTTATGNLEINPNRIAIGQMDVAVENLQEIFGNQIPGKLYGGARGKIEGFSFNGKQGWKIEGIGTSVYWEQLFSENVVFDATLIDQKGPIHLMANQVTWDTMLLDHIDFQTEIFEGKRPFSLETSGTWKYPLTGRALGNWEYTPSSFSCSIETLTGTFNDEPLRLTKPLDIAVSSKLFQVSDLDLQLGAAHLFLNLKESPHKTEGELLVEKFPLQLLPFENSVSGTLNGKMNLLATPEITSGNLTASIDSIPSETLSASGKFEGKFSQDRLDLEGALRLQEKPLLSLNLSLPLHIGIEPFETSFLYDQKVKGNLSFSGKVEEILDFLNLGNHRLEGDLSCNLNLSGTFGSPELHGSLQFENGRYENYITGTELTKIEAKARAKQDRLLFDSFSAKGGEGTITATGELRFLPSESFPFLFDLDLNRFLLTQIDLVTAEANGHIQFIGNAKEAEARGHLDLVKSNLHIPDRIPYSPPDLVVVYRNPIKPIEKPTLPLSKLYPIHLDLEVNAPDGIFIEGRGLNSEWKGLFHLGGTFTDVAANGKLELIKGSFGFAGRSFKLIDGSLSFIGKEHEMPTLNLAGVMEIKDISITARLKGPLNNPQITFQSNPPLPMSSIVSYLLFGQELAEINSFQALQLANSLAALAGQSPDVLETTRKALGVDQLNIVTVAGNGADVEDTIAVQVGKYVSEGVLVSLTQGAEDSSTNISIEIELNKGFSVQLESDQRQEQGKFTVKWNHNY